MVNILVNHLQSAWFAIHLYMHRIRELDLDGKCLNMVQVAESAGWKSGVEVSRKDGGEHGKLVEVLEKNCVVELKGGQKYTVPTKDFLNNLWKRVDAPAPAELYRGEQLEAYEHGMLLAKMKAHVQMLLCNATAANAKVWKKLQLQKLPRAVKAMESFEVGMLELVPSTDRIDIKVEGAISGLCIGHFVIKGWGSQTCFCFPCKSLHCVGLHGVSCHSFHAMSCTSCHAMPWHVRSYRSIPF